MTGWSREEAIGKPLAEVFRIIDGSTRKTARDPMEMAVEQDRTVGLTVNCVLIRRDGFESAIEDSAAPIHDRAGRVIGAVIVFHDVSAARAMSLQMTHSAQHDLVTNLPNRLLLNDRISQSIALARRQNRPIAVIFLDLDHFKYINDSLGHAIGDQLLQSVSKRLLAGVRGSDTVSRQGGDEFVILLSEISLSGRRGHKRDKNTSFAQHAPLHRGARSAYRWQHRYQHLSGRRRRCRNTNQECRHGDVPRQGKRAQQFPVLQAGNESEGRGAAISRRQLAPRHRARRVLVALSAEGKSRHGRDHRSRGVDTLAATRSRTRPSLPVRAHRRGLRPDSPDRPLGDARSMQASARLAGGGTAALAYFRQCFRRRVPRQGVSGRCSDDTRRKLAWKRDISNSNSPKASLWRMPSPRPPYFKS